MFTTLGKKYTSDGGNEQRVFIKDSIIGWKELLVDTCCHLFNGVTRDNYVETLGLTLDGQSRRVRDNFVDKCDHTNDNNPDYEEAILVRLAGKCGEPLTSGRRSSI